MKEHILFAYKLDGKGGGSSIDLDNILDIIASRGKTWLHMDANHENTEEFLRNEALQLNNFIVNALLAEETRPRMEEVKDGVLLILRGVNLNDNASPEDMISIRLWIDKNRIISLQRRQLKAVLDIKEKIKYFKGPENSAQFVNMLISLMIERMSPSLEILDDSISDIEEKILENPDASFREDIIEIRKQAIMFRRYIAPQRDAIGQLRMSGVAWLSDIDKRHVQEGYNHIMRYVEDLDAIKERAQIVKDELSNILSDRLNKNMYLLSVIAAIFLPLSFLTGLLGINVRGIPGAENGDAFMVFCLILSVIVLLQIAVFKRFKLF
jgi:zinc transporter